MFLRKAVSVWTLGLILLAFVLVFIPTSVPVANAATFIQSKTCRATSAASCTSGTMATAISKNDQIIVGVIAYTSGAACPVPAVTLSDVGGNTFSSTPTNCVGTTNGLSVTIFYATAASSVAAATETITATGTAGTYTVLEFFAVTESGATVFSGYGFGTYPQGTGGTSPAGLNASLTYDANAFIFAVTSWAGTVGVGSGCGTLTFIAMGGDVNSGAEYGSAGLGGTTSCSLPFTSTAPATARREVGVVFEPATSSSTSQTQSIGSCPTNTATFAMVNSTIYWYTGNALTSEVVNTISTSVSSVSGSNPHTLRLLIYATASAGTPSASDPATKRYEQAYSLSGGTTKSVITVQVSVALGSLTAGQFWAVGVVGDSHINLNQSSLSGLYTQTGSASTASQPSSFSSIGTSVATKIYLCATASYQTSVTSVTTTTAAASTTTVVTSTATVVDANTAITSSTGFTLLLLVVLTPALALGGMVMFYTKNGLMGITAMTGGLVIGAALGNQAGIVPLWIVFTLLFVCVFWMLAVFRSGGGGGA